MNLLQSIGFNITDESQLETLFIQAQTNRVYANDQGYYCRIDDISGASILFHCDHKDEIEAVYPFFIKANSKDICISEQLSTFDQSYFIGAINPTDAQNPESGDYPLLVEVVDYYKLNDLSFPLTKRLLLNTFLLEGVFYHDIEDFTHSNENPEHPREDLFYFPAGILTPDEEPNENPEPLAIYTGEIVEVNKHQNTIGCGSYYELLLKTIGGVFTVLCDGENYTPSVGNILEGQFWVSALIGK